MRIGIDARAALSVTDGIGRYAIELLRAYSRRGENNEYIVLKHPDQKTSFEFDDRFSEVSVAVNRFSVREQYELPRLLSTLRLDLFHALHSVLPLLYHGVRIATVHDIMPYVLPYFFGETSIRSKISGVYLNSLVRWSVEKADMIIVDSDHTLNDLIKHFHANRERLRRVYLGASHLTVDPSEDSDDNIRRYNLSKPFLITVTNFRPYKNIPKLLEAFVQANKIIPNLSLVIVGKNDKYFSKVMKKYGNLFSNDIHLLGFVPDDVLVSLLRSAAAFVFPSLYEGFGLPVLEAMAAGVPVITTRAASLPEIGGEAVLYVDPNNQSEIAGAMVAICKDDALSKAIRTRGYVQVKKFHWDDTAEQTLKVYDQTLRKS